MLVIIEQKKKNSFRVSIMKHDFTLAKAKIIHQLTNLGPNVMNIHLSKTFYILVKEH
jgi:hypothetical protein